MEGEVFRECLIYSLHVVIQYTERNPTLSFVLIFNLNVLPAFKAIFGRLSLVLHTICEKNVCSEVFQRFTDEWLFAGTWLRWLFLQHSPHAAYSVLCPMAVLLPSCPSCRLTVFIAATRNLLCKYSWLTSYLWRVGLFGFFWGWKNYLNWCLRRKEEGWVCKYYWSKPAVVG